MRVGARALVGVEVAHADPLPVVVFLQVGAQTRRQREALHTVVCRVRDDGRPRQLLETEGLLTWQGRRQHRLEEHYTRRILIMLDQSGDSVGAEHGRVVAVETELVFEVLDARVKRAAILPERDREQVLLLRRIA